MRSSANGLESRLSTAGARQVGGHGIAPRSKTRLFASPTRPATRSFWSLKGYDCDTVYPNGISTSVAEATQDAFLRTIPGLSHVEVRRYGYAIEYDYVRPARLES